MFLLLRLYLGHLVADFPLQTDEIYRLKVKTWQGTFLHAAIVSLAMAGMAFPYWENIWIWLFVILIGITHVLEDRFKVKLESRVPDRFLLFSLDQGIHLALLILLYFLIPPLRQLPRPNLGTSFWAGLYLSDFSILLLIGSVLVAFAGPYVLNTFTTTYFKKQRQDIFLTRAELYHGLFERMGVFSLLFCGGPWLAGMPVLWLIRMPFKRLRSGLQILLSTGWVLVVFLMMKLLALRI